MRAAQVSRLDGPSSVEVVDLPEPDDAGGTRVVIDVAAAGICFPDVLLTRGAVPGHPRPALRPGLRGRGRGCAPRPSGSGFEEGDRVAAFPFLGGFAEVVAADPEVVFPLPERTTYEQGAALPMNYLTCHFALRERGRLREGETVLVHGAAGGIGTAAVQLAKAWGARVIAVVSTDDKAEVARQAGADEVVLADGFRDAVADLTGGPGRRPRRRPRGRRPLHRLAALARPRRPAARHRLHRRGRSPRSRSTGCCSTTSPSSASAGAPGGRTPPARARLSSGASGTTSSRSWSRGRSTRSSARCATSPRRPTRSPPSTSAGPSARSC